MGNAIDNAGQYPGTPVQAARWIPFRNSGGSVIPAFAAVSLTAAASTSAAGQFFWDGEQPPSDYVDGGDFLIAFNGPQAVPSGAYGRCTQDWPCWARLDSGFTGGMFSLVSPQPSQWEMADGCLFRVVSDVKGSGGEKRALVSLMPLASSPEWAGGINSNFVGTGTVPFVERFAVGCAFSALASGVHTFAIPGLYHSIYTLQLSCAGFPTDGIGHGATRYAYLKKNGASVLDSITTFAHTHKYPADGSVTGGPVSVVLAASTLVELAATDTLELYTSDSGDVLTEILAGGSGGNPDACATWHLRFVGAP